MRSKSSLIPALLAVAVAAACAGCGDGDSSCYRVRDGEVFLRYYGGYPRASEVFLKVRGADAGTFRYIDGSRRGDCQGGHIFARDGRRAYYRNLHIEGADAASFRVLSSGYSRDAENVFFREKAVPGADAATFFVIADTKGRPYGADGRGLFHKDMRVNVPVDTKSFEILFPPYFRDGHRVYYGKELRVIPGADPGSFTCPPYRQVINYQYYAFDRARAYYYEGGAVASISGIDAATFTVLGTHYAKDRGRVYYKGRVVEGADPASFHVPNRLRQSEGKDRLGKYINGKIAGNF